MSSNDITWQNRKDEKSFGYYKPLNNGLTLDKNGIKHGSGQIGEVRDDPRLHRRALFLCCDKALVWDEKQRNNTKDHGLRPLAVAYNQPRFMFDFHTAGGLMGHVWIGFVKDGQGKWFHEWADVNVSYVDGEMQYRLRDDEFPGVEVELGAIALSDAIGLLITAKVNQGGRGFLVWGYGGASGASHNWMKAEENYTFRSKFCDRNKIELRDNQFSLTREYTSDDSYFTNFERMLNKLPGWAPSVTGGCTRDCMLQLGSPKDMLISPAKLWEHSLSQSSTAGDHVVVGRCNIDSDNWACAMAVGTGSGIGDALKDTGKALQSARAYNARILSRVVAKTPDPYLDSAVAMTALLTEGTWAYESYVHGGWSWRMAYLGWRIWYGPLCYGWPDRVKKSIQSHIDISLNHDGDDMGAVGYMLEDGKTVYYNMNEVFIDHLRAYIDYTNDMELFRDIFEWVKGIVEWENRRLRPGSQLLYESVLNTWISDSHWNIRGQCAQASAYMYRAYSLLAELAARLCEDDEPFKNAAREIYTAMQNTLWMKRKGVFAESLDTRGKCQLHPEPELATLYHTIEFGLADEFQTAQMLDWAARNLRIESTTGEGKLYWSSNWFPNRGRKATHSTYILNYGEECNFALAQFQAGDAEEGYALLRGCMNGFFNGPAPGGLSCQCHEDGTQVANEDFADSSSMFGKAVVEGLFGIVPRIPNGKIILTPMFPEAWKTAAIETPLLSYEYKKSDGCVAIEWNSPNAIMLELNLPLRAMEVSSVLVDGVEVDFSEKPGIGFTWIGVTVSSGLKGTVAVHYRPRLCMPPRDVQNIKQGDIVTLDTGGGTEVYDPQGLLGNPSITAGKLQGNIVGNPGTGLLFVRQGGGCPWWEKIPLCIESAEERLPLVWKPLDIKDRDISRWALIDISSQFNASTPAEAIRQVVKCATAPAFPASRISFEYWIEHLIGRGLRKQEPSLDAWKSKVGKDGIGWTYEGIPFLSDAAGLCMTVVTLAGGYPSAIEMDTNIEGRELYLMLTGLTFPAQSHVVNLRIKLYDRDNNVTVHDLVNPFDIGDCWSVWAGRYHDTARNGFENLGGRFGVAGSHMVKDMTLPVEVDTEAHLLKLPIQGMHITKICVEAAANDAIFALMGVTALK